MKLTQTEVVIDVMKTMGGFARLSDLYSKVLNAELVVWKTKTPEASIRRIVQDQRYFFKIRTGLWALNEFKDKLPNHIASLSDKYSHTTEYEINYHSYNQGLLIDSGNMLGFKTYVPAQDQNRKYLNTTLKNIANFIELPEFTYKSVLNRIRSVDVMWLDGNNDSLYPKKVFEVENSTDFIKSLNKFNELKFFSLEMVVVAPDHKKKLFQDTLKWDIYRPLESRVEFWDYDSLEVACNHQKKKMLHKLLF